MNDRKTQPPKAAAEKAAASTSVEPKLAIIQLHPTKFTIAGPLELIIATEQLIDRLKGIDPEQAKFHILDMWDDQDWSVRCSASGEWIKLSELKYWDVDTQNVYAKPELVPQPVWEESRADFEARMHALLDKHSSTQNRRKHR